MSTTGTQCRSRVESLRRLRELGAIPDRTTIEVLVLAACADKIESLQEELANKAADLDACRAESAKIKEELTFRKRPCAVED
jgi:hypothetical protein